MERMIDSTAILVVCLVFKALVGFEPYDIVGLLIASIAVCAVALLRPVAARVVSLSAFLAACVVLPFDHAFLPVAACLCMFERNMAMKLSWTVAWMLMAALFDASHPMLVLCLCIAAALLAWNTARDHDDLRYLSESRNYANSKVFALSQERRKATTEKAAASDEGEPDFDPLEGLTQRERQVAMLVSKGKDNSAIAEELFLSEGTVRNYISTILSKKQLKNRTQLAVLCLNSHEG